MEAEERQQQEQEERQRKLDKYARSRRCVATRVDPCGATLRIPTCCYVCYSDNNRCTYITSENSVVLSCRCELAVCQDCARALLAKEEDAYSCLACPGCGHVSRDILMPPPVPTPASPDSESPDSEAQASLPLLDPLKEMKFLKHKPLLDAIDFIMMETKISDFNPICVICHDDFKLGGVPVQYICHRGCWGPMCQECVFQCTRHGDKGGSSNNYDKIRCYHDCSHGVSCFAHTREAQAVEDELIALASKKLLPSFRFSKKENLNNVSNKLQLAGLFQKLQELGVMAKLKYGDDQTQFAEFDEDYNTNTKMMLSAIAAYYFEREHLFLQRGGGRRRGGSAPSAAAAPPDGDAAAAVGAEAPAPADGFGEEELTVDTLPIPAFNALVAKPDVFFERLIQFRNDVNNFVRIVPFGELVVGRDSIYDMESRDKHLDLRWFALGDFTILPPKPPPSSVSNGGIVATAAAAAAAAAAETETEDEDEDSGAPVSITQRALASLSADPSKAKSFTRLRVMGRLVSPLAGDVPGIDEPMVELELEDWFVNAEPAAGPPLFEAHQRGVCAVPRGNADCRVMLVSLGLTSRNYVILIY
jgi:hypothetical protein